MKMRKPLPRVIPAAAGVLIVLTCTVCSGGGKDPVHDDPVTPSTAQVGAGGDTAPEPGDDKPKLLGYEVVARYPHDKEAYTQGLLIVDGKLYEGTGRYGESSVRLVDLKTGKVLKERRVDIGLFGEGIASVGGLLYQLTWKSGKALLYDRETLRPLSYGYTYKDTFKGEGWGLTTTPEGLLVLSDGSDVLHFLEPKGMKEKRRISVTDRGRKVINLNELEWIDGEIWANVWKSDRIARIDPKTGKVLAWVNLRGILGTYRVESRIEDVLYGIEYDEETGDIFVTGKHWPTLFHSRVK